MNGAVLIKKKRTPALSPPPAHLRTTSTTNLGAFTTNINRAARIKKREKDHRPAFLRVSTTSFAGRITSRAARIKTYARPKPPVKHMCSDNIRWYSDNNDFCELLQYTREEEEGDNEVMAFAKKGLAAIEGQEEGSDPWYFVNIHHLTRSAGTTHRVNCRCCRRCLRWRR